LAGHHALPGDTGRHAEKSDRASGGFGEGMDAMKPPALGWQANWKKSELKKHFLKPASGGLL